MTGRFRNRNVSALLALVEDNANLYLIAVLLTLLCSCELAGDGIQMQIMLQEVLESPILISSQVRPMLSSTDATFSRRGRFSELPIGSNQGQQQNVYASHVE